MAVQAAVPDPCVRNGMGGLFASTTGLEPTRSSQVVVNAEAGTDQGKGILFRPRNARLWKRLVEETVPACHDKRSCAKARMQREFFGARPVGGGCEEGLGKAALPRSAPRCVNEFLTTARTPLINTFPNFIGC